MKNNKASIYRAWLEQAVSDESSGAEAVSYAVAMLGELIDKILQLIRASAYIPTRKRLAELLEEADKLADSYIKALSSSRKEALSQAVRRETEFLSGFAGTIGKSYVIPAGIEGKVLSMPAGSLQDYRQATENEARRVRQAVHAAAVLAYMAKEDTEQTASRLSRTLGSLSRTVSLDSSILNTAAYRNTDLLVFKRNGQKVVLSPVLDTSICLVCGEYSEKSFDISSAPAVPVHYNCRCTLVPAEAVPDEGIGSFESFLDGLDDANKERVLGKGRFELYERGVKIHSFTDNGALVSISALKNMAIQNNQ